MFRIEMAVAQNYLGSGFSQINLMIEYILELNRK